MFEKKKIINFDKNRKQKANTINKPKLQFPFFIQKFNCRKRSEK